MIESKRALECTGTPLTLMIRSPPRRPALNAGMSGGTLLTRTSPFSIQPAAPCPVRPSNTGVTVVSKYLPARSMVRCSGVLSPSCQMTSSRWDSPLR